MQKVKILNKIQRESKVKYRENKVKYRENKVKYRENKVKYRLTSAYLTIMIH